jgi:hypothetical protein
LSLSGLKFSHAKCSGQFIPLSIKGGSHVLRTCVQSSRQGGRRRLS